MLMSSAMSRESWTAKLRLLCVALDQLVLSTGDIYSIGHCGRGLFGCFRFIQRLAISACILLATPMNNANHMAWI